MTDENLNSRCINRCINQNHGLGVLGLVFGLWLSGVFAASLYCRGNLQGYNSIIVMTASVIWPLFVFSIGPWSFIPKLPTISRTIAFSIFTMFGGLSLIVSVKPMQSISYFILTLTGFLLAMQFNSNLTPKQFEFGLKVFTLFTLALLVGFAMHDYRPGLRLGEGTKLQNPNAIAMVSFSVVLASTVFKNWIFRYALMLPAIGIIILTGSRASTMAAIVGLTVILFLRTKAGNIRMIMLTVFLIMLGMVAIVAYSDRVLPELEGFFDLHGKHRGIESGASGRTRAWAETWQLFQQSPVIGNGFRAHEARIKIATSAHNGYLSLLAEIGIFGFMGAMYLVISGYFSLWRECNNKLQLHYKSMLLGLSSGYLFLGIFERYLFNFGNPTSLLFLIAIMATKLPTLCARHDAK